VPDVTNCNELESRIERAIFAAVPEPFFVFDGEGRYLQIIGGADRSRYHDGTHLVGKRIHDVIEKNMADVFVDQINQALESDSVRTYVYSLAASDVAGSEKLPGPAGKQWFEAHISPVKQMEGQARMVVWIAFNITQLHSALAEKQHLIEDLQKASKEIKTLRGIIPICSHCKKIRDDKGFWNQLEAYLFKHSEADLTHSICPDCVEEYYSNFSGK